MHAYFAYVQMCIVNVGNITYSTRRRKKRRGTVHSMATVDHPLQYLQINATGVLQHKERGRQTAFCCMFVVNKTTTTKTMLDFYCIFDQTSHSQVRCSREFSQWSDANIFHGGANRRAVLLLQLLLLHLASIPLLQCATQRIRTAHCRGTAMPGTCRLH